MEKIIKYAAVLCGGSGQRAGLGYNKALFCLGGKTMLETVLNKFCGFDKILVVANLNDIKAVKEIAQNYGAEVISGGATRTDSARFAVNHLFKTGNPEAVVVIHDAARPYVSCDLIDRTVESAVEFGSGVAAVKVIDSLKRAENFTVTEAVDRNDLYAMQTPQTFRLNEIFSAYATADEVFTDDGEVYRRAGYELNLVEGEYSNKKMTVNEDFADSNSKSIGTGFDVHRLVKKRRLILGGVEIPYEKGLLGHSDADVLLHAIADAVLSAAGAQDIGVLFPDTDSENKDMDSSIILRAANKKLAESQQKIVYVSVVIIAQKPKLAPFINEMRQKIAQILDVEPQKVNISATTTEFLGIIGRGKAIAAQATCLCCQRVVDSTLDK